MYFPLLVGVLCFLCFGMHYFVSFLVLQDEERTGRFAFVVSRMSCYCICLVALPMVTWVGLQSVIVIFPDHTRLFSC